MSERVDLQAATVNTLMGSLLSLFNAIIVIEYFTDIVWVILLIGVMTAMVLTIVRRLGRPFDPINFIFMLLVSILFTYALYQRSMNTQIPLSSEVFWPAAPVIIYIVWTGLLEVVLRRII